MLILNPEITAFLAYISYLVKNLCDCLQYIPDLAEKGICCRKNPEAATVGVL